MPLLRVEVRNEYALGAPELYREANKEDPKEILEGVTVAGLVGVLRQLGDLAEFAGEVFHGLQEEVTRTSSRSRKLMDRVQRIEAALSPLEKVVLAQKSHLHFAYTAGSNWHARIRCRKSHFLYTEVPQFIMDSYEDCHDLPNLHLLDKFDPGGPGSCLKRYSDPTFFKRASVASGDVSAKKIPKDKKGRRIKKRRSWTSNGELSRDASFSHPSSRMQFTRLNIGGQPSPTPTATTLRSELDEQSNLHLRNGSGYTEGDSRPSYSVPPEEQESRESISSPVMRRNSDFLDYDFLREKVTDAYDYVNLSHEQAASSSSVTWDEKGETFDHITQESNDDDMIQEHDNRHVGSFSPNLDLETVDDNAFDVEMEGKMNVQPQAVRVLESTDVHLDDIESETDHFMDALNTIESEGDTDVDVGKKKELQQYSKLEDTRVHDDACLPGEHNVEYQFSSIECNVLANDSLTSAADVGCGHLNSVSPISPHKTNGSISGVAAKDEVILVSLDERTLQTSQTDVVSTTPGSSLKAEDECNSASLVDKTLQLSQADAMSSTPGSPVLAKDEFNIVSLVDMTLQSSETDGLPLTRGSPLLAKDVCNSVSLVDETLQSSQTDAISSIPGIPLRAEDEFNSASLPDKTLQLAERDGLSLTPGSPGSVDFEKNGSIIAGKNVESISCSVSPNLKDNELSMPINDGATSSLESQKHASDTSSVASVTFWTNGGLLGLQPSKPPDFSTLNGNTQDPVYEKDGKISSSDQSENQKRIEESHDMNSSNCLEEYRESGISSRKPSWKISPADLNIDFGKLGVSLHSKTSSIGSNATASGNFLPVNATIQAIRKHQEYSGSSSQMFGLSNSLRLNGSNKKLLPAGDENSYAVEQKNHRNAAYQKYSGRNKDRGESPILSPSSSPPLQHMKMSFQPMDGFETSKLKLKFPEGNINSKSVSDIFPSFQLVPEASIARHNVRSDSDDDTFYRSSPSVSDDCHSIRSESNSEQWESSESPTSKDHELYDALRRISLTESVSSVPEKGRTNQEDVHNNSGFLSVGIGLQNSETSQMFDQQSVGSLSHSFRKELRNGTTQKDIVKPHFEPSPDTPPLPPVQWRGMTPHLDGTEGLHEIMPEDSYYGFHFQHSSSTISQPKPAPSNGENTDTVNLQKHKFTSDTNGQREVRQGKSTDEKGDFLQQIRMKSFNLRPTFIDKPTALPPEATTRVQVTAILEKANAIRQAVGSDEEDDGTWSDT